MDKKEESIAMKKMDFAPLWEISHEAMKWSKKPPAATAHVGILHDYAKMMVLMWNDPRSCEMVILMLNSKFLNLESSRRLMRSCQVSIWT